MAERLVKHGMRVFGPSSIDEAWEEFGLWEQQESYDEAFGTDDIRIQLFMPYYLYDWTPDEESEVFPAAPRDIPIALDYLEKHRRNLSGYEQRFLTASVTSPFSFHDVREVDPGRGFVLRDIFLGTEAKVTERQGSARAQKGDILFGKVVQIDHVAMLCGTGWVMIPPREKQPILELRKKIRNAPCRNGEPPDAETLRDYDIELREVFLDLEQIVTAPPRLHNTDDEEFSFHRITYRISSPQAAFDGLKSLSLCESEEEMLEERDASGALKKATITWHKRGNAKHSTWEHTILGRFMIDGSELVIEVNSERRAKRAKAEVEKRLKGAATHESTVLQSPESALREQEAHRDPEADAQRDREKQEFANLPEVQEQLRKMMQAHWDKWFHEKIPALGNKTPLQAAKSADGREMLEALLLDYERHDARSQMPYKTDYRLMRERLGLSAD